MDHVRVDSQVARQLNAAAVFDLLKNRRVTSRMELVRETGLSKATISEIVDRFVREGFVRARGRGEANGGRPPILLEFDPRARFAIGVQLGEAEVRATLTDLNAEPIRSLSTPTFTTSADDAIAAATPLIAELNAELPAGSLLGLGVGTPGLVDSRSGVIQMAPDLGWRNVPVGPRLAQHFALPAAVVNRAKAAALGEAWCGAGRSSTNLVYMSISTGLAAGVVIGGQLYRGVSMSEGEIGHVTVIPDGPLCACGNRGCLQAVAAGPAILSRVREKVRGSRSGSLAGLANSELDLLTLEMVADAAAAHNPIVEEVMDEMALYLGIGAANLVNILNPGMLILGGRVIRALPQLVPLIEAMVRRRAMAVPAGAVEVVPSQLGDDAVPVGAAAFLLSQVSAI